MSDARMKACPGSDVTVTFDGGRCLHFAEGVRGLPEVFDVSARPQRENRMALCACARSANRPFCDNTCHA